MQDELYESAIAFLQDRQLDHATDATHRFETATGGEKFAALVDIGLAQYVGNYQDESVKVQEFLSPTFALHFGITIFNGEQSNLQSLVKAMTQLMIGGGSGTDDSGVWRVLRRRSEI